MERRRISPAYEKSLNGNIRQIKDNLEPFRILDHLVQEGLINIEEAQELREKRIRDEQINCLLQKILFFGDNFSVFLDALKNNNYGYLARSIEETAESVSKPAVKHTPVASDEDVVDGPNRSVVYLTNPIEITKDFSNSERAGNISDPTVKREYDKYTSLLEHCNGWTSCTSSRNVMDAVERHKNDIGRYLVWYCRKMSCVTLTIVDPKSENHCLHYRLKTKEKDGKSLYKFNDDHISESVTALLEKIKTDGISRKK